MKTRRNINLQGHGWLMFKQLRKIFYLYILKRKYYRIGQCNACGRCCQKIYVKHKNVIQSEDEFEKLKLLHPFCTYLRVIDKDETGLVFECMNLDKETNKCKIHKHRPGICRRYPQEELFMMGGTLAEHCGYRLEPIISFDEIFQKISRKNKKI